MKKLLILLTVFALSGGNLWAHGDEKHAKSERESVPQDASKATDKNTVYTCPMHPDVRQNKPGQCPMCGMNLEPAKDQATTENKADSHAGHQH